MEQIRTSSFQGIPFWINLILEFSSIFHESIVGCEFSMGKSHTILADFPIALWGGSDGFRSCRQDCAGKKI